jgi:transposase
VSVDLVPDDLWDRVAPLLPARRPRRHRYPGRLPVDDRAALRGIVCVLCKDVSWRDVPAEQVGRSGVTAWRRLRDWTEAGLWPQLHEVLLTELRAAGLLDMDDVAIDGPHVRALTGPSPVDRARSGSKHHVIVDRRGTPLAVSLTSGNRHDVTQLVPVLVAIPRIPRGPRPASPPACRSRSLGRRTAGPEGTVHGSGPGKTRWVVERTFTWLHQFKRPRIRYEIRADLHLALLQLACSIICLRRLRTSS